LSILFSIIIPCLNEEQYIEKTLRSALSQTTGSNRTEIIVVDGMSTDGSREILKNYCSRYNNIKLIDNHRKITPVAFNLGIKNSSGEYIVIWGAHAEYGKDFLENSLLLFKKHPEIACAGGPIISEGEGSFGKAAAYAMSGFLGVGNAKHRFPDYEGYAEMACFPVFKREVFDEVGYYDESLVKNQDDEFCFRLRLNGGKIYISPEIKSIYYTRNSPGALFRQYFNYGFWRIAVLKKHKIPISYRQQVPALFFSVIFILILLSFIVKNIWIGIILPILYLLIILIFTFSEFFKSGVRTAVLIPLALSIIHFSYAAGFVYGMVKVFRDRIFGRY
jgi:succinoglycan biosynthesis protein ExoA